MFDLLGRKVPTNGHAEWNAGEFSLNISGLSPGLYLLRVESGGKVYVAEFVKIRD
ncbi:MAG: T9SS type A sorting domain-containing protein [Saprospirales bacterium]|nr:T9SS type A sorting domain-containing protein [Saprospirales bacterium]